MTALADLPLLASGKVREIYDLGDELLIVASDRISTYDVVHPTPIPVRSGLSLPFFLKASIFRSTTLFAADVPKNRDGASHGPKDD